MPSFIYLSLIKLGLFIYRWVVLLVAYTLGYGWLMMRQTIYLLLRVHTWLIIVKQDHMINRNMENHPGK